MANEEPPKSHISKKLEDARSGIAQFSEHVGKNFPSANTDDAIAPPAPSQDPSAVDSTPPIELSREAREHLKQSRGMTDADIDAMDYDDKVDFFQSEHQAAEARRVQSTSAPSSAPSLGQGYQLTERGFPSDVIRGLSADEAEKLIATGATFASVRGTPAPAPAAQEAAPVAAGTTKEQRLILGTQLDWPPDVRNKLRPEQAEMIIKHGVTYAQYQERLRRQANAAPKPPEVVPPTIESNPILASDERAAARQKLDQTINGLAAVALDAKQRLNQAFIEGGPGKAVEQQLFVAKMAAAAEARTKANELVRAQASKSNLLMNKLRDFEVKDLYLFSPDVKKALDDALKAEHEAYVLGVGIVKPERKHDLIKALILDPAESKRQAREEGLSVREKGVLDKLAEKYQTLPAYQRVIISGAAMAGVGAAFFGGGIGLAAILASAGSAGALYKASQMEEGIYKQGLTTAGGLMGIGGIASLAMRFITRGLHKVAGTEKKAEKALAQTEGFKDLLRFDEFLAQEQKYSEALNVDKFIARDQALFGSTASFAAGAVVGAAMRGGPEAQVEHTAGEVPKADVADVAPKADVAAAPASPLGPEGSFSGAGNVGIGENSISLETGNLEGGPADMLASREVGAGITLEGGSSGVETDAISAGSDAAPQPSVESTIRPENGNLEGGPANLLSPDGGAISPESGNLEGGPADMIAERGLADDITLEGESVEGIEVAIEQGDYAGKALLELKEKLELEYKDVPASDIPPSVKQILEAENINELTRELGFAWGDASDGSQSLTLEPGDSIGIKNGEFVFTRDGEDHVVIDEKGEVNPLDHKGRALSAEGEPAPAAAPSADAPVRESAPLPERDTQPAAPAVEREATTVPPPVERTATEKPVAEAAPAAPAAEAPPAAPSTRGYYTLEDFNAAEVHPGGLVSAPPVESFTNSFGTAVNAEQAGVYAFRPDDSGNEYPVVYGGDSLSMESVAQRFLSEHKDAKLLFETLVPNGEGGVEKQIGVFALGDDGNVSAEPYGFEEMSPDVRIDPNQFSKPLRT